jgi:hypothetical protein
MNKRSSQTKYLNVKSKSLLWTNVVVKILNCSKSHSMVVPFFIQKAVAQSGFTQVKNSIR